MKGFGILNYNEFYSYFYILNTQFSFISKFGRVPNFENYAV